MQNEVIRKNKITKSLLETRTSFLETVSKPSIEEEKEEEKVSPTRNEIIEEIQWQRQSSGRKKIKTILTIYTLETLVLIPKSMIFMNYMD